MIREMQFQFHNGSIKREAEYSSAQEDFGFNSTMVRLKARKIN